MALPLAFASLWAALESSTSFGPFRMVKKLYQSQFYYLEIDSNRSPLLYNQVMAFIPTLKEYSKEFNSEIASHGHNYSGQKESVEEQQQVRMDDVLKEKSSIITYAPGYGAYKFTFEGQEVWINIENKQQGGASEGMMGSGGGRSSSTSSTIELSIDRKQRSTLEKLLKSAEDAYASVISDLVLVYSPKLYDTIFDYVFRPRRPASTMILSPEAEALVSDAHSFFDPIRKSYYLQHGIPYRRGYLLYGKPGNGKSSFCLSLASDVNRNIYFMSINANNMDDNRLRLLFNRIPGGSIILLEDVDSLFKDTVTMTQDDKNAGGTAIVRTANDSVNVSMSGLLNAIDGVSAQEGSLLIMTTNHEERLDEALKRSGRVDKKIEFKLPSPELATKMFRHLFHLSEQDPLVNKFRETWERRTNSEMRPLSFADLQSRFLQCHDTGYCWCFTTAESFKGLPLSTRLRPEHNPTLHRRWEGLPNLARANNAEGDQEIYAYLCDEQGRRVCMDIPRNCLTIPNGLDDNDWSKTFPFIDQGGQAIASNTRYVPVPFRYVTSDSGSDVHGWLSTPDGDSTDYSIIICKKSLVSGDGKTPLTKAPCKLSLHSTTDKVSQKIPSVIRNDQWKLRSAIGKSNITFGQLFSLSPLLSHSADGQAVLVTVGTAQFEMRDLFMEAEGANGVAKETQRFALVPAFDSNFKKACNEKRRQSCIESFLRQLAI